MNFSNQLQAYLELHGFSQELLAEKIYVTRQTISKWENNKTYPDIHNLIALSVLFDITLDELIRGDVDIMRDCITNKQMVRNVFTMYLLLLLMLIIGVPSIIIWGLWGLIPFILFWMIAMFFAFKMETFKKEKNIKTYKEILAFLEGADNLDEIRAKRNRKKYIQEKITGVLLCALIGGFSALIIGLITGLFTQ